MLELESFKSVVSSTPLVSIDLVVRNCREQVLLGLRNNRPAQGYWFVPGGRIRKDESINLAFKRLTAEELNVECSLNQASFLGPYEHFYQDNFSGTDFTTHYVVLAYELSLDFDLDNLPASQHRDYRWFSETELLANDRVHQNSTAYFSEYLNPVSGSQDC